MIGDDRPRGPLVLPAGRRGAPELVGGKGHGLERLAGLGLAVPCWITVTTAAMATVLETVEGQIEQIARAVPNGDAAAAREASQAIARLVRQAPWPSALERELEERLMALCSEGGLAVRSSAVGEDGTLQSFAGQLTTILQLNREGVPAAVRECWAGAYSERAILYRQARGGGLAAAPVRAAVVIQEMVDACVSGVAFTADPLTGAPALVVTAGLGLGQGVVSDEVETDTYVRELGAEDWQVTVRQKTRRVVPRRDGAAGVEVEQVPLPESDQPALNPTELYTLAAALRQIDSSAAVPQDVEWAIDRAAKLWILQARPVSPMPSGELAIWDDSNIGESYPGLTRPLTCSYVQMAYQRLFGRALRLAGVAARQVERAWPAMAQLVGVVRGRLYMNLVAYYRLFLLVPGLEWTARKWESALGVTRHFDLATLRERRGWRRLWHRFLAVRTAASLAMRFWRLRRDVRRFEERAEEMVRRFGGVDLANRQIDELWRVFERITAEYLDDWVLLIYNDFFAFLFEDQLARLCGRGQGTELHQRLLGSVAELRSLAPLQSLLALVEAARAEPGIATLLRSDRPPEEVWAELARCAGGERFRAQAEEHLRVHGQRTIQELKLETPSLADTPWVLVSLLRNHLDLAPSVRAGRRPDAAAAEAELKQRLRGRPFRGWYAGWVARRAREAIADRESMSYARARAYGVLRRVFRAMGEALARAGALERPEDVFYLTLDDLGRYARGGSLDRELGEVVQRRRAEYGVFSGESLPHRITCRGPVAAERFARSASAAAAGTTGVLRGLPCSPGRVRGIARVLHEPSPGERVDGEILVAPVTEPGWIFLMLAARGLVVERGSILSHAAIIGRELGVPTVVGVEGATRRIASGDELEMDGGTGEVWVVRRVV